MVGYPLVVSMWIYILIYTCQPENNRKRVLDSDIVKKVSPFLKGERIDLTHTVCAFYLNCSLDYRKCMNSFGVL
jgi:hypothetical protein